MQDVDRIREANLAIDRRAQQREASARALSELTPEAIAAEEERQRAYLTGAAVEDHDLAWDYTDLVGQGEDGTLQDKLDRELAEAEGPRPSEEVIGLGRLAFQWVLAEEEAGDYELAIQIQVDDQAPAGFVATITPGMLADWATGKGLQGNRMEHKHFAAGLFDRVLRVAATETTNQLVYLLENLMAVVGEPTRTSVGDDEPAPELSE